VSSCYEDGASVKTCSTQKQNCVLNDDVFISSSRGDLSGYVYSQGIADTQCNDAFKTTLGQQNTDKNISRRTSERYNSDVHWTVQSFAVPPRSSGTFSFSESARLCHSCGTRVTNSISHYGSQESLSFSEFHTSADVYATICSVFWKMSLTFHPFVSNAQNQLSTFVEFSSLWPNSRSLACLLPEICASLQGSIEALCRIAIFADVVKLLSALIELRIVGKLFLSLLQKYVIPNTSHNSGMMSYIECFIVKLLVVYIYIGFWCQRSDDMC